jgi:uncharacterized protein YndB with AHSA1/START domain
MKDTITKQVQLSSSVDSVWNAISKQEEISKWFLSADFQAKKGYQYTFTSPKEDCSPIVGEVKSADPYTLIYTWIILGTEIETEVKWILEPNGNGTKLTLEHSGISNYGDVNAIKMFEDFNGGWDNCLNGLSHFLMVEVHEV